VGYRDPIFWDSFSTPKTNKNCPYAQHNLQMCPYAQYMNSGKDGKFSYRLKQKIHQFLGTNNFTHTQV
jgi:hypothetical protein